MPNIIAELLTKIIRILNKILPNGISNILKKIIIKCILQIPKIKKICISDIKKQYIRNILSIQKQYDSINVPKYYEIPEMGIGINDCINYINKYVDYVNNQLLDIKMSGTVYSIKYTNKKYDTNNDNVSILDVYGHIYKNMCMWNHLHSEFIIGNLISLQLVSCVAQLFGRSIKNTQGIITNGGTRSIMSAAQIYMNYGINKGFSRNNCVIIAPDTIHAALYKAEKAYGFRLLITKTRYGVIDYNDLESKLKYYKYFNNTYFVVGIFCSYPSYPYGNKDDVNELSLLAKKYKTQLHVDCCLGGFVSTFDANIWSENVTSISIDIHKYGMSPKGISVLLFCPNWLENLVYKVPNWKGGIYGTLGDEGSVSIIPVMVSLVTILYYGKEYYEKCAKTIVSVSNKIREKIEKNEQIEIYSPRDTIMIAFKIKNSNAAYYISEMMKKNKYNFNELSDGIIHWCVTPRFAINESYNIDTFIELLLNSISKVTNNNYNIMEYPNAKMYCSVDNINTCNCNFDELLFGQYFLDHAITNHCLAINNPYICDRNI